MKRKNKRHFHTEKQTIENLSNRIDSLSDFIFDISPSAIQCNCTSLSLAHKTPLTVVSDDSIVILYMCMDCNTPIPLIGLFSAHLWIVEDMKPSYLSILLDAAKQAGETTIFRMLLEYKIRKSAPNN